MDGLQVTGNNKILLFMEKVNLENNKDVHEISIAILEIYRNSCIPRRDHILYLSHAKFISNPAQQIT